MDMIFFWSLYKIINKKIQHILNFAIIVIVQS